jgi:hypothetical protein
LKPADPQGIPNPDRPPSSRNHEENHEKNPGQRPKPRVSRLAQAVAAGERRARPLAQCLNALFRVFGMFRGPRLAATTEYTEYTEELEQNQDS